MPTSTLDALTTINVPPATAARLRLTTPRLQLRRAWPRAADHLLLEYADGNGGIIAGQWFAGVARLHEALDETSAAIQAQGDDGADCWIACTTAGPSTRVLLQAGGADRRLPALAPMVARADARLLVHQPERRAVVRLDRPGGPLYAKAVRPLRLASVVVAGRAARELAGMAFTTPLPVEFDEEQGIVIWSALQGVALYDLLGGERMIAAARAAGTTLRRLHRASTPVDMRVHSASEEIAMLQTWIERASTFVPSLGERLVAAAPPAMAALLAGTSPAVPLHRDFYDKQVFLDGEQVGVLDFDTLARGEAALDVANALVHFELRALQGRCTWEQATQASTAFLDGYAPDRVVTARIPAYAAATRLRLACVYAFRPCWRGCVAALVEQLAHTDLG